MAQRMVIGLTGAVGAGKSSVRQWLAAAGALTLDADAVVHRLLASNPAVRHAVRARFGPAVFADGAIDRTVLGEVVFGDAEALADLERLLHPAVLAECVAWLAAHESAVRVVEAVKLIEGGLASLVDSVWLVTCGRAERHARLVARGWSPAVAAQRMSAGPRLAAELACADVVIDNSGPWPATERQLAVAWASVGGGNGRVR